MSEQEMDMLDIEDDLVELCEEQNEEQRKKMSIKQQQPQHQQQQQQPQHQQQQQQKQQPRQQQQQQQQRQQQKQQQQQQNNNRRKQRNQRDQRDQRNQDRARGISLETRMETFERLARRTTALGKSVRRAIEAERLPGHLILGYMNRYKNVCKNMDYELNKE
ncbi:probable E3 ubiquitin-protein ligase bre1 [Topomyia yanbarensis]|uniref:probable E3 ubiquitin-protein ligase bre1 n=1 Tax=Topomyia yanbarensis TaxID=2498891 RepID=UPI00273BC321|nr:probable E3 ubiquitin-protein ligase bre1 [Topomyia yanbarensis]XP_058817074.1 probable E3 ubiquitin-protein ligase bre1 [Topomyia yanbarensis]XP_058817085.1 probable E3 ubiquitin-protein ligase bre1 [Topomyia yanbarensis]XP_058817087.1 probable E3 ubiquitin-protein ligase bre1 [Topomyia yanbarensis]XP_058839183.1 probable E3 ubiquitin-protein ligase bre1 [Topomyia yanbarensis]XP_058839378.1 probable E3 ubiquitin-protein ligase bre1 [Topomyia yanbarensis]XP_058840552.1 probable E3 ubiquiti